MKATIFAHYFKRAATEPMNIFVVTVLPTVLIIILSSVMGQNVPEGHEYLLDYHGYNIIATNAAIMMMTGFQFFAGLALLDYLNGDFRADRRWRLFSTPVKNNDFIFGAIAAVFVYAVLQGLVIIGVSLFMRVYWGNIFVLLGTLLLIAAIAQMFYMLFFLLFKNLQTIQTITQIVVWIMLFASGWVSMGPGAMEGESPVLEFFFTYGTPISLARRAITESGIFADYGMGESLFSMGILLAIAVMMGTAVAVLGKLKGFGDTQKSITKSLNTTAESLKIEEPKAIGTVKRVLITFLRDMVGLESPQKATAKVAEVTDEPLKIEKVTISKLDLKHSPPNAGAGFTMFQTALIRGFSNPFSLVLNALLPIVFILVPGFWEGEFASGFFFIGMALMYGALLAARSILNDRMDGTIIRIHTAPVSTLNYLTQNFLAAMIPLLVQVVIVCFFGFVIYDWPLGFTFALMLIYVLFAAAMVSMSFAWSCIFKSKEVSYSTFAGAATVIAMFSGFWFPLEFLPSVLQYVGAIFPAYWLSYGIIQLTDYGVTSWYWISAGAILIFTGLYLLFGGKRRII